MYVIPWLSLLIAFPLAGAFIVALVGREESSLAKGLGVGVMAIEFFLSIPVYMGFDSSSASLQFVEFHSWIDAIGAHYHVGVDGISLLLIMLTTFLGPIVMLSIWTAVERASKEFVICLLLLQTAMIGTFAAANLFLFYLFWELMLIPMYLIIGVWGGPRRIYATVKFFLYTMAGSLLMLVAFFVIYRMAVQQFGAPTLEIAKLYDLRITSTDNALFGLSTQGLLFAAFALAFAVKVPMFPFHTWLPDAHVEAPTAGSVILAAVLLKMGTYGFVRLAMPLFPQATASATPLIAVLAVIGIVYGALVAMVQPDIKKLVAYSSVSHLGFVMLGLVTLNAMGVQGAILQMINHGFSTGALFLIVGMIYERRHTRMIEDFGGIARIMPIFTLLFMIVTLSSIGLPGTNGFVGEFLILVGAYREAFAHWYGLSAPTPGFPGGLLGVSLAVFATTGVIFGAVYMLWMFQRVMFGPVKHEVNKTLRDLSLREVLVLLPIIAMIFVIGLYPKPFLKTMETSVDAFNQRMLAATQTADADEEPEAETAWNGLFGAH